MFQSTAGDQYQGGGGAKKSPPPPGPGRVMKDNIVFGQSSAFLAIVGRAAKIRHASLCVIIAGKSSHHLCIFCSLIEVAKELSVSQMTGKDSEMIGQNL